MSEQHIMIDLETLSNRPANGVIIALAAVNFAPYDGPLVDCTQALPLTYANDENELYMTIDLKSSVDFGLEIDPETQRWWLATGRISEYIRMVRDVDAVTVPQALRLLMEFAVTVHDGGVYGWSHGSMYDMRFLEEKYVRFANHGVMNPFSHKRVMDTRTVIKTHRDVLGYDVVWPEPKIQHHPIDDARRQAYVMQCSLRNLKACVKKEG